MDMAENEKIISIGDSGKNSPMGLMHGVRSERLAAPVVRHTTHRKATV